MSRPFSPSSDPEEFSGAEDAEWEVDEVVSEEVTVFGTPRYEVRWADWSRKDGSNTSWHSELKSSDGNSEHPAMQRWLKRSQETRDSMARDSLSVPLQPSYVPPHAYHTWEKANAYEEKLARSTAQGSEGRYAGWYGIEDISQGATSSTRSSRTRDTPRSSSQTPSSHTMSRGRSSSTVPSHQSGVGTPAPVASSSKRPATQTADGRKGKRQKKPLTARQRLLRRWEDPCLEAGAPALHMSDDQSNESIPPVSDDFVYLENEYFLDNLEIPNDADYLAGCDCTGSCQNADHCSCHSMFEGAPSHAYDDQGLCLLDRLVVVECNKLCGCSNTCRNRVAQRPRDVDVDIFHTPDRGWGARALHDLPRGKFLGLYTGRLIRREEAARLDEAHRSYTFDVDALESNDPDAAENPPDEYKYSVEAYSCGNWTRFVNHSCEPNVSVISVMWDSIPQMNRPFLAFFTNQAIAARTEFTIDYDPKSANDKGKGPRPPGCKACLCRSSKCRGWVAV